MKNRSGEVIFLNRGEQLGQRAATGVSLHCHTLHSKELLDFVPYYANRIPVASFFWKREMRRYKEQNGSVPDFKSGYWEPPLTGPAVFESESKSLASMGLASIVSITDHDSISGTLELRRAKDASCAPISLEWTLPFENAFFHIGVHNLPIERAEAITRDLLEYSFSKCVPDSKGLVELLEMLNELPCALVVLNHPIWDIEMIGQQEHERVLSRFLDHHAQWIHALEINGFRSWQENQAVIDLAESIRKPIISGGDRHCCQANTMVNMTDAMSFEEFVSEIRTDGQSRVVVTPGYHVSLPVRQLRSMAQILVNYKHFPAARRLWSDRVFLDYHDGQGLRSLTDSWGDKNPLWTYFAFFALSTLAHPIMEPFISLTVGDNDIGREETKAGATAFPINETALLAE
jgi:hypothetical protein